MEKCEASSNNLSALVKSYKCQDCQDRGIEEQILQQLSKFEVLLAQPKFANENNLTEDLVLSLVDLLSLSEEDGGAFVAQKSISVLYKMAQNPFLLEYLTETYKILLPICAYFNANVKKDDALVKVPVLELLFLLSTSKGDSVAVKTTIMNLLPLLKNNTFAEIALGCLRNFFAFTNLDAMNFTEFENEKLGRFLIRINSLGHSDDLIKSIYALTIILSFFKKQLTYGSVLPRKSDFFQESLRLLEKTIGVRNAEIKEARLFFCKYLIENNELRNGIDEKDFSLDKIINLTSKLDESDCNATATCEFILCILKKCTPTFLELFLNVTHLDSNFKVLKTWLLKCLTEGIDYKLPLLAIQVINGVIKNNGVTNEILQIIKKVGLLELINEIFLKNKISSSATGFLNIQVECLNLISVLCQEIECRKVIAKGLNCFITAVFESNLIFNYHNKKCELGMVIAIQAIYILSKARDNFTAEVQELLGEFNEENDLESALALGLSNNSNPVLRSASSRVISALEKSQSTSLNYLAILQKIIENNSNDSSPSRISPPISNLPIKDEFSNNKSLSGSGSIREHYERKLHENYLEKETLTKAYFSLEAAFKDQMNLVARYGSQEVKSSAMTAHLLDELEESNKMRACLDEQVQHQSALLREKSEETEKLRKELTAQVRESQIKDSEIEELQTQMKKLMDEMVVYKHDVAKYMELDSSKKEQIDCYKTKIAGLENVVTQLNKENENKDDSIQSLTTKNNDLQHELKVKSSDLASKTNELEETKKLMEQARLLFTRK